MNNRVKKVRELARQLDAAESERNKITSEIDERIRLLEKELAAFVGGKSSGSSSSSADDPPPNDSSTEGKSYGSRVIAFLRSNPGTDSPTLIGFLYGKDDGDPERNKGRFRVLMHHLRLSSRVKRLPGKPARWEATTKDAE